ncbi:hypothetical protein BV898_14684 [Hypsibius exemplaris]|uniref:Uncharacterized protein n=1 Tax=Hypsibius exemplaris TaxID=2072580 RepID=A0A9X6NAQ2_HYPEX|nr:hypothetical protein BV898_14684 [Hypsibius exemplaris]
MSPTFEVARDEVMKRHRGCNDQNGLSSLAAALDVLVFTLNMDSMAKRFSNSKIGAGDNRFKRCFIHQFLYGFGGATGPEQLVFM